jgi:hypothetical protein
MFKMALLTIPTLRQAQGRLSRKGREKWGTRRSQYGREKAGPSTSLASLRSGRDDRALIGFRPIERICVGVRLGPILVG